MYLVLISNTQAIGSLDKGIFCSIMHITDHFLLSTVQMLDRQESLLWSWFSVRDQLAKHVKLLLNAANLLPKKYKGTKVLIPICFLYVLPGVRSDGCLTYLHIMEVLVFHERSVSKACEAAAKCS